MPYSQTEELTVKAVKPREGTNAKGPWYSMSVLDADGRWLACFTKSKDDPVFQVKKGDVIQAEVERQGTFWNFRLVDGPTDEVGSYTAPQTAPQAPRTAVPPKEDVRVVLGRVEVSDAVLSELAREVISKSVKTIESELEVIKDMLTNPLH